MRLLTTKWKIFRHSSLIATTWFPGSAWEPTESQALPAFATIEPEDAGGGASKTVRSQAEPGNEHVGGGVQREVSIFLGFNFKLSSRDWLLRHKVIPPMHTKCTRCEREILLSTASKNGGLCAVCKRQAKKLVEKQNLWSHSPAHQPAATSNDELSILRRVVRQASIVELKLEYADWLEGIGEVTKAEFLRKFMSAYETLAHEDLPSFDSVDPSWARMIGGNYLQCLIEKTQHYSLDERSRMRDVIFEHAEPAIVVRYCTQEDAYSGFEPSQGSSFYFGSPDLEPSMKWPTYSDCLHEFEDTEGQISPDSPCLFACQIRNSELLPFVAGNCFELHSSPTQRVTKLQVDQLIYFFTYVEADCLGTQSIFVATSNEVSSLQRRTQPEGASEMNEAIGPRPIFFLEELSLPQGFYSCFEEIRDLAIIGSDAMNIYDSISASGMVPHESGWADLRMFGYLHASSGGDPSKTTSHRNLASVHCSLGASTITLGIDDESLKNGDWGKAKIAWQDWDG